MSWKTQTHTLVHPVVIDDVTISSIAIREPDVEALEAMEELGIEAGKPLRVKHIRGIIAALSDQPTEIIGKMHRDDFAALGEKIGPLFEPTDRLGGG